MKKFWKKILICTFAFVCVFLATGCTDEDVEVSVDLDGDGHISVWESVFEVEEPSHRQEHESDLVEIWSVNDLKAINESTASKCYVLMSDIDCGGQALAIDFHDSVLFGNNKTIKNFKLAPKSTDTLTNANADMTTIGIIYNTRLIFDLKLFMGKQDINLNQKSNYTIVSPLIDAGEIDSVSVRGFLNISRPKVDGLGTNSVDVSLVAATTDGKNYDDIKHFEVWNTIVEGKIKYVEQGDAATNTRIGGIVPWVNESARVINCCVNADMDIVASNTLNLGLIAGESGRSAWNNHSLITSCEAQGNIKTNYLLRCMTMNVGGIVGLNNKIAEVKDCISKASINFDDPENIPISSSSIRLNYGGIVGKNDAGILDYVTSDANLNIKNANRIYIGGIAGVSNFGILSNVLCRGGIDCNNVNNLYVSNMVGMSSYGYYEKCIINTKIDVNNSDTASYIYLGGITIFEDLTMKPGERNFVKCPNMKQILLDGINNISTNGDAKTGNEFVYNLGIRNSFTYEVINSATDGEIVEGDPENREYITRFPDEFSDINVLKSFKINHYVTTNGLRELQNLNYEYKKDKVQLRDGTTVFQNQNFFYLQLGFKFGANHNEIAFDGIENYTFDRFRFTLTDQKALTTGYFEKKHYNNDLCYFDYYIEDPCQESTSDELFSLLNYVLQSGKDQRFRLAVAKDFFVTKDDNDVDAGNTSSDREIIYDGGVGSLEDKVSKLLQLIDLVNVATIHLDMDGNIIEDDEVISDIKYLQFSFLNSSNNVRYVFKIDISDLINNSTSQVFIFNVEYLKLNVTPTA